MFQLTRFLHNTVFFRNQNARYAGTRCIYIFNRVRVLHLNRLKEGTWLHNFGNSGGRLSFNDKDKDTDNTSSSQINTSSSNNYRLSKSNGYIYVFVANESTEDQATAWMEFEWYSSKPSLKIRTANAIFWIYLGGTPSYIYSYSIGHILEHEFCHLGCRADVGQ